MSAASSATSETVLELFERLKTALQKESDHECDEQSARKRESEHVAVGHRTPLFTLSSPASGTGPSQYTVW